MTSANNQGFPFFSSPLVGADGMASDTWYRAFLNFWRRSGQGFLPSGLAAYLQVSDSANGLPVEVHRSSDGKFLGNVPLVNNTGGPAQPIPATGSPQTYIAKVDGTLIVFGARLDASRDHGATWYPVTLQGGAFPMLTNDEALITWFSDNPPQMVYFPIQ